MEKDGEKQMPFRISYSNIMYFDFIFDSLLSPSPPTHITYMLNTIMGQAFLKQLKHLRQRCKVSTFLFLVQLFFPVGFFLKEYTIKKSGLL